MSWKSLHLILCLFLMSNFALGQDTQMASSEELQKWIDKDKETTRAKSDDHVLIVIVTVKENLKNEFETWIEDILYAALYKSESQMKKAQLNATRWLEAVNQNEDQTWSYAWLMDPVIPDTNYDIPRFLNLEYGEELGKLHWDKYLSFMAQPPQSFFLRQTPK